MSTDVLSVSERKIRKIGSGRLLQVVLTKVSKEDDIFLQQLTDKAYQVGAIKERSKSELLRLIITLVSSELRNRPDLIPLLLPNQP
jgi:predicted regulator of Ras-like GTPase activity (Roadblock/LC7/MglB family)